MSNRPEVAEYLMAMARELAVLARTQRFEPASSLFEMAHLSLAQELKAIEDSATKSA